MFCKSIQAKRGRPQINRQNIPTARTSHSKRSCCGNIGSGRICCGNIGCRTYAARTFGAGRRAAEEMYLDGCVSEFIDEFEVFKILDTIKATSASLDGIPHWFLRIAVPFLCKPVAFLCNQSIFFSFIPKQWKSSIITPVAKSSQPKVCADFRPISVTSILCRLLEKLIITKFLYRYPVLTHTDYNSLFRDQFAFRPAHSTTAALIKSLAYNKFTFTKSWLCTFDRVRFFKGFWLCSTFYIYQKAIPVSHP